MSTAGETLAASYLAALEAGDLAGVLALFADDGIVKSPLYGPREPEQFFTQLFADTARAQLTLRGVTEGSSPDGAALVTVWFHFDWSLPGGTAAPFDVVDVMELDGRGLIHTLNIVYDTVDVRPAFEQDTGTVSWRASDPA